MYEIELTIKLKDTDTTDRYDPGTEIASTVFKLETGELPEHKVKASTTAIATLAVVAFTDGVRALEGDIIKGPRTEKKVALLNDEQAAQLLKDAGLGHLVPEDKDQPQATEADLVPAPGAGG